MAANLLNPKQATDYFFDERTASIALQYLPMSDALLKLSYIQTGFRYLFLKLFSLREISSRINLQRHR